MGDGASALRQVWVISDFWTCSPLAQRFDAVLNEACAFRHGVVKPARDRVRLVGVPENARRPRLFGRANDRGDERPADATTPPGLPDIPVLQIALRVEEPGALLKEVVRKADERFVALGDNARAAVRAGRKCAPRSRSSPLCSRGAIEVEIGAPQRRPLLAIRALNRPHSKVWQPSPSRFSSPRQTHDRAKDRGLPAS